MLVFTFIDNWLFDNVFQKFADWFRDTYGKTSFWLAAMCVYCYLFFYLAGHFLEESSSVSATWQALLILAWMIVAVVFEWRDRREQNSLTQTMNSNRISGPYKFIRIAGLFMLVVDVLLFLPAVMVGTLQLLDTGIDWIKDVLFCAVYYFAACDTKPRKPKPVQKTTEAPANALLEPT